MTKTERSAKTMSLVHIWKRLLSLHILLQFTNRVKMLITSWEVSYRN